MAKVIFTYNGYETIIQCLKEDKMKNICNKYASKINLNINSLLFIYGGNQVNLELTFESQASSFDKERNQMNILVYDADQQDENGLKCPKCGEVIHLDKYDALIKFNSYQNDMLNELKNEIEVIKNINDINKIKNKIKVINLIITGLIEENLKNTKSIQNIINNNINELNNIKNNLNNNKNIIKGMIEVEDDYKDIAIFNQLVEDEGFDVYLNDEKVEIIKSYKILYKNFKNQKGKKEFKIIFKDKIPNLERIFQGCSDLISLDLTNFDTTNITSMGYMFNKCHKLKEIKGINKFNTSKVNNMRTMFQECKEIEYLDLSNFDTSNVTDMGWMFCNCNNLKSLNLLKFELKNNCNTQNMFAFNSKDACKFITNNNNLKQLYYS